MRGVVRGAEHGEGSTSGEGLGEGTGEWGEILLLLLNDTYIPLHLSG